MSASAQDPDGPETRAIALRDHFLGWHCRIRQYAIRHAGGRPTLGMQPRVSLEASGAELGRITVLIVKAESGKITAQLRHMVLKTHDPAERLDSALNFLAAAYYQNPAEFYDEPTALFGPASDLADRLLAAGRCRLSFEQYSQKYDLICEARQLGEDEPAFQATYWHNGLFNPNLPAGVRMLAFRPDWTAATAEPPVP